MGSYIGKKPTDVPLTSSDITDNIITSAKIVDDAITSAKINNGSITGDDIHSTFNISGKTVTLPAASVTAHASDYIDWQSVQTTNFTAVAGRGYPINTTGGAITMTLPASANTGDTIKFLDYARNFGANNLTINSNSLKYQGTAATDITYSTTGQAVTLTYIDTTKGWIPTVDDDSTFKTAVSIDYMVLAGGGCGGFSEYHGGGGGAGGLRASYSTTGGGGSQEQSLEAVKGNAITVTVGAGAAATTADNQVQNNGSDSSLSGTGISTITSLGGGASGAYGANQKQSGFQGSVSPSGGCGGGGSSSGGQQLTGGSGTSGQGYDGGNGSGSGSNFGGGGGGGTGAAGGNGTGSTGGNGGNGISNNITGSAVTYGGGGGGSTYNGGTPGSGGSGGGGAGSTGQATAGTANLGGGGGGSERNGSTGTAGGSGIVILRVPTADYSGTTTGSPTVTTDGNDKVIKFTGSGSYTP